MNLFARLALGSINIAKNYSRQGGFNDHTVSNILCSSLRAFSAADGARVFKVKGKAGGLALSIMMSLLISSSSLAQTDFTIRSESPNLQSEYQKELDKWMIKAYEGDRDAQFKVGVLFSNDQFSSSDDEQAVYWYKQAARQGHVLAQFNLGHHYLTGEGAKRDESVAMNWWLKAAQQDHALAAFNVGRAYYLGIGLAEDHTLARHWFERAAQNKEPKSIEILEKLGWAEKGQYTAKTGQSSQNGVTAAINAGTNRKTVTPKTAAQPPATPASTEATTAELRPGANRAEPFVSKTEPIEPFQTSETVELEPAIAEPTIVNTAPNVEAANISHPLAIYTNPAKRSVLVTILDNRDGITLVERADDWVIVSREMGLPVWVHENFIDVNNKKADKNGTITGSSVNARSVPLIASGTVIGQLDKDEKVDVIDKQNEWYRIQSPARFKGWAKTSEFDTKPVATQEPTLAGIDTSANESVQISVANDSKTDKAEPVKNLSPVTPSVTQTNEWLFSQPEDNYTLQLASFDDPAKSAEFETRKKFNNDPNLRRLSSSRNGVEWTYYLYGSYASLLEAEDERERIKQGKAWIRSFGRLQQNRCLAWKKQVPAPSELNTYCVN